MCQELAAALAINHLRVEMNTRIKCLDVLSVGVWRNVIPHLRTRAGAAIASLTIPKMPVGETVKSQLFLPIVGCVADEKNLIREVIEGRTNGCSRPKAAVRWFFSQTSVDVN